MNLRGRRLVRIPATDARRFTVTADDARRAAAARGTRHLRPQS
jgi:hypothetical protein